MKKLKGLVGRYIPAHSFLSHVLALMTGTTFAQAVTVLAAPVLTRLYSPDDYGMMALFISISGVLAVIACWRYELAIVLPEKDEEAANLLILSIGINFGMCLLTLLAVVLFRQQIANLLGAPPLARWLWFLPLSLLSSGLFQAFNYWSTRRKQFGRLAIRQVTQSTVAIGTQLAAGLLGAGAGGLIGGSILGQIAATGRLGWQIAKEEGHLIKKFVSNGMLKYQFFRYRNFPLFSSWSGLLNTASTMLPALMLGYFFNPTIVGYYALGQKVLSLPMGLIGGAVAQVFFPRATQAKFEGNLGSLTLNTFSHLLTLGVTPILLLAASAPQLFTFVFGHQWVTAGVYMRWLSLWLLLVFVSSPISTLFVVLEKQRIGLMFDLTLFVGRFLVLLIGGLKKDPLLAIALFGSIGALLWLGECFWLLIQAGNTSNSVIKEFLKCFLNAFPYLVIPIILSITRSTSYSIIVSTVVAGLVFAIIQVRKSIRVGNN